MCKVWILEFGDFGFWGFWILGILDFGFWRFLEFGGLGILDWQVVTKFWMLHKKRRLCTPTGSADYDWYSRKGFQKNVENIFIQIRLILVMISIWQSSPSFPRYPCFFFKVLGYHQVFNSKIDPNLGIQPLNSSNFMDGTAAFLF